MMPGHDRVKSENDKTSYAENNFMPLIRKEIYHNTLILYFKASGLKTDKGLRSRAAGA